MAWIRASQGGSDPTNITPSNANPPSMVTNGVYKSTGSGYAISSYSNITPRNDETVALTSGNIYKATGNGVAVASVTTIVPSSISPVYLEPNKNYKPDVSGYAVAGVNPLTPSNTTPERFISSAVYKPDADGYAISSYQNVTPSAGGTAFNAGIVKMAAGGYACTSRPGAGNFGFLYATKASSKGVNTWTFAKGAYSSMSVALILLCIHSSEARSSASNQYVYYIDVLHDPNYYHYLSGSSATGTRVALAAPPATSSKKIAYSDSGSSITISYHEGGNGMPVNDIFIVLKA